MRYKEEEEEDSRPSSFSTCIRRDLSIDIQYKPISFKKRAVSAVLESYQETTDE